MCVFKKRFFLQNPVENFSNAFFVERSARYARADTKSDGEAIHVTDVLKVFFGPFPVFAAFWLKMTIWIFSRILSISHPKSII